VKTTLDSTQAVEQITTLFQSLQRLAPTRNIKAARKIERQIVPLVHSVAAQWPNTSAHADALFYYECTLLALSRMTRRKDVSGRLRDAAYKLGAQSVDIRLKGKRDLGTGFATYNLAIDLIGSHNQPALGLQYMLKARRILKALPANQLPRSFQFFWIEYGIAKAYRDLGQTEKSARQLKRTLGPVLSAYDFGDLRGIAKCAELLAEIDIDRRSKK